MKTTFSRIFYPTAVVLLAALLLVGAALQTLVKDHLKDQSIQALERDAQLIASLGAARYSEGSLSGPDFLVNLSLVSQVAEANAVIFSESGRLVLCSDSPLGCEHQGWQIDESYLQRIIQDGRAIDEAMTLRLYEEVRHVVSYPILDAQNHAMGFVMVSAPVNSAQVLLDRISHIYLAVSLLTVLAAVIVITLVVRRQSNPLKEMSQAARKFGHGQLDARVKLSESYPQEVYELALAFNNMASSLEKSEYQRQEFVANVSHELKTPMTTIGGYIDGMLDGTIPPEKREYYMRVVSDETKRLSRLVRSMLDISRLQDQGGMPEEKKSRFDVVEAAGQVLISFEGKINEKKINVDVIFPEHPVYTHANQDAITQVLYNLVDNAVKFTPEGENLALIIREGKDKIYLSVANDGQTIPPEELPLVFDRFHKLDKSRSQNREGWGLGLYIVKTIVDSHHENISVSSREGVTEFTFTLPLIP